MVSTDGTVYTIIVPQAVSIFYSTMNLIGELLVLKPSATNSKTLLIVYKYLYVLKFITYFNYLILNIQI